MRIGLSSCFFHADPTRPVFKGKTLVYAEQSIWHWAMSQGVPAYLIPPAPPTGRITVRDLVDDLDGLILQGGSDVAPESYGEKPLKPEWAGDAIRDAYEKELIHEFLNHGKPVLGICRGAQVINIAFGGTMYQDIATQLPGARNHRNWEIYDQNFHTVAIDPGSRLALLYPGVREARVNTVHHQAIKALAPGMRAEASCPEDGVIEALRLDDPRQYVFGVQWHPEFQDPSNPALLDPAPILADFLNEARERRS